MLSYFWCWNYPTKMNIRKYLIQNGCRKPWKRRSQTHVICGSLLYIAKHEEGRLSPCLSTIQPMRRHHNPAYSLSSNDLSFNTAPPSFPFPNRIAPLHCSPNLLMVHHSLHVPKQFLCYSQINSILFTKLSTFFVLKVDSFWWPRRFWLLPVQSLILRTSRPSRRQSRPNGTKQAAWPGVAPRVDKQAWLRVTRWALFSTFLHLSHLAYAGISVCFPLNQMKLVWRVNTGDYIISFPGFGKHDNSTMGLPTGPQKPPHRRRDCLAHRPSCEFFLPLLSSSYPPLLFQTHL